MKIEALSVTKADVAAVALMLQSIDVLSLNAQDLHKSVQEFVNANPVVDYSPSPAGAFDVYGAHPLDSVRKKRPCCLCFKSCSLCQAPCHLIHVVVLDDRRNLKAFREDGRQRFCMHQAV